MKADSQQDFDRRFEFMVESIKHSCNGILNSTSKKEAQKHLKIIEGTTDAYVALLKDNERYLSKTRYAYLRVGSADLPPASSPERN